MKRNEITNLKSTAHRARNTILKLAQNGGCFIGSALSCIDLLVFLYSHVLKISPQDPKEEGRDYFFLSKGHAVPALYATLCEFGFFDPDRLLAHISGRDMIYWHPHTSVPGVEFHSGSLGHLLSVALGTALGSRLKHGNNRAFILCGDGELNEGSNWEALLAAKAFRLDSLTLIVDRNRLQANEETEVLIPLEPLDEKFNAFGASVCRGDGHSFSWMSEVFGQLPFFRGNPNVIIADTVRGKGIPSLENKKEKWFCSLTEKEAKRLSEELNGNGNEKPESEIQGAPS